jgi:DNA-directed RNA polymerase specialized sigma24 family protein
VALENASVADLAPQDDSDLFRHARSGDAQAWSALSRQQAPRLAAYLGARLHRPGVVERLVGEAIVIAWTRLSEVEDWRSFPSWFRKLGASLAMQWHADNPGERLKEPFPESRCLELGQHRRMIALQEALQRLPEAERMALEQSFRGGLDGEELAEVLHCDATAAALLVERALETLAREMDA